MRRSALALIVAVIAGVAVFGAAATLGVSSKKVDAFGSGQAATTSSSSSVPVDGIPPIMTAREFLDTNVDGKIDQVKVTYNEALGAYAGTTANWTLSASRPSGMSASPATVTISGSTVLLDWTTLSTSPTTAATMTLTLTSSAAVRDLAGNFASSFSNQAVADKAAPALLTLEAFDDRTGGATNGKIDRVGATFSETLAAYTAGTGVWTLDNAPGGAANTVSSVAVSGTDVTLNLNEGNTNTAVGSGATAFRIDLASSATGIRDAAGNLTAFTDRAVTDKANPVFLEVTDSDTGGSSPDGLFEDDDWIEFHFSEAMDLSTAVNPADVTLTEGPGSNDDRLAIEGLLATTALGGDGYLSAANNAVASYADSVVSLSNGNRTIHVELSSCSPAGAAPCTQRGASSGSVSLTVLASVKGTDGLGVLGTVTKSSYRMM